MSFPTRIKKRGEEDPPDPLTLPDSRGKHRNDLVREGVRNGAPRNMPIFELAVQERAPPKDVCPAHEWPPIRNIHWDGREISDPLVGGIKNFRKLDP